MAELYREAGGAGPRLALVHGFTQSRRCWGPLAAALERDHEVVRIDAPGHGRSSGVSVGLWEAARLLGDAGGPATWLGYSMGGRLCLHLALSRPDRVQRLVLLGATPGIEAPAERAARAAADARLADRIEAIGVEAFVDEWLRQPLFAGLGPGAACREERLESTAAGLASALRLLGTGAQEPLWDRLGELGARGVPVLVVVGERDEKFAAIGERMTAAIGGRAELRRIPGAGHAAHLERPDLFVEALRGWLEALGGG